MSLSFSSNKMPRNTALPQTSEDENKRFSMTSATLPADDRSFSNLAGCAFNRAFAFSASCCTCTTVCLCCSASSICSRAIFSAARHPAHSSMNSLAASAPFCLACSVASRSASKSCCEKLSVAHAGLLLWPTRRLFFMAADSVRKHKPFHIRFLRQGKNYAPFHPAIDEVFSHLVRMCRQKNPKRVLELSRDYWSVSASITAEFMRSLQNVI